MRDLPPPGEGKPAQLSSEPQRAQHDVTVIRLHMQAVAAGRHAESKHPPVRKSSRLLGTGSVHRHRTVQLSFGNRSLTVAARRPTVSQKQKV
jgi:hypothetical protein